MSAEEFTTGPVALGKEIKEVPFNLTSLVTPQDTLVLKMKREFFGGTYTMVAVSRFTSEAGNIGHLTVILKFSNNKYIQLTINIVPKPFSGEYVVETARGLIRDGTTTSTVMVAVLDGHSINAVVHIKSNNTTINIRLDNIALDDFNRCDMVADLIQHYISKSNYNPHSLTSISPPRGPVITINADTDVFLGRDLGQVYFLIKDTIKYHHNQGETTDGDVIATQFTRYPCLTEVVRGSGHTLIEKVSYLSGGVDMTTLLGGIVTYGMLRLFLSRLMYGDFDIDYLMGKYTTRFYSDLEDSRYSAFSEAFLDPVIMGYEMYFVYDRDE
jgi:hypothetical protein